MTAWDDAGAPAPDWRASEDADQADPDLPDAEPVPHDPDGLDLAAIIAAQTLSAPGSPGGLLPPPRGVRNRARRPSQPSDGQWSGSGPDPRDPQLLGSAIDELVSAQGWRRQLTVRSLLDRWPDLVGEVNAAHSTVEAYLDGVLTIRCDSTTWATSLRTLAPQVVAELNRRLGDGSVQRVQVLGPSAPSWKHGHRSVRDGRGPRDTYG